MLSASQPNANGFGENEFEGAYGIIAEVEDTATIAQIAPRVHLDWVLDIR